MAQEKLSGFEQYGLSPEIMEALSLLGYDEPTEIQQSVLPLAMKEQDLVAKSETGSGKTAAFGIPICENVIWDMREPQALVLEPTRELAVQVSNELFYIGRKKRLKVPAVFGGLPIDKQIVTLKQKNHIIVGTPGRVMDHIRRKSLKLSEIKYLVIDEADLMFDMGFADEVREILDLLPEQKNMMLFSATSNENIDRLVHAYMKQPVFIDLTKETETVSSVQQKYMAVSNSEKYHAFLSALIMENPSDAMIFCGTREMVNTLYQKLKRDKIRCGMLHGEMDQKDRLRTIEGFREGRFHYLIATDVAARGVDFPQVTHIFNYDFPIGKETYVHRIGRTGRNGKEGVAISFVTPDDENMKKSVENYIRSSLIQIEDAAETRERRKIFFDRQTEPVKLKASKGAVFKKSIVKLVIGGGKKSKMRTIDIVGAICSIPDITPEDIGIIDVRDSLSYVEILNDKGNIVLDALQEKAIKGKVRKVRKG